MEAKTWQWHFNYPMSFIPLVSFFPKKRKGSFKTCIALKSHSVCPHDEEGLIPEYFKGGA